MDVGDVRRLAITAMIAGLLVALWALFLVLHDHSLFEWAWPRAALGNMGLGPWLAVCAGIAIVFLLAFAMIVRGIPDAPGGLTKASLRQVQCQDCKAVFFIRDTGHRPLTHVCPSCRALGVYDGRAPPVGQPPQPEKPKKIVMLDLTCRRCHHRFDVTDTGHRPLHITCPRCRSVGDIL